MARLDRWTQRLEGSNQVGLNCDLVLGSRIGILGWVVRLPVAYSKPPLRCSQLGFSWACSAISSQIDLLFL